MEQFFVILQQLFIFSVFIIIGIISVKFNILNDIALEYFSKFIIMITMPIMLFTNMLTGPKLNELLKSLPILFLYLISFISLYLLNSIISKIFKFDKNKKNMFKALATFSNAGFIGIPLICSLFNKEGVVFMSLCMIIDQLMLWTLGIKLTSKSTNKVNSFNNLKNILNPALVAIILSIAGIICGFTLPSTIKLALAPIGNLTPPLSLIYIGGLMCYSDVKKYLKNIEIYIIIFIKMLLFPIILWLFYKNLSLPINMIKTVVLLTALPTMSSIAMFAKKYDNYSNYAIGTVLITTISSIITIPIVSLFTDYF